MSKSRWTPEFMQQLLSMIRAGAFPQVAAQALGVPAAVFEKWLRRGQNPKARGPLAALAKEVGQAQAQARVRAEAETLEKHARAWLEHGPGREPGDMPAWSSAVSQRGSASADKTPADNEELLRQEVQTLIVVLLDALEPFPEARVAAASALKEHDEKELEKQKAEEGKRKKEGSRVQNSFLFLN